jgi:apolipoprotein N-acyltransferase
MTADQTARWKRRLLLVGAGVSGALALPPIGLWPLLLVAVPLVLHQLERVPGGRQAFGAGFLVGLGYFVVALQWIGVAFLVDAATYLWMMPFAVGGLAAFMALYWGLAGLVAWGLFRRGVSLAFGFPAVLAAAEWLRGHLLTGFPWAAPGLAATGMGGVLQLAALIGMTGLSLLIMLWAAMPFALWRGGRERWLALAVLALMPLAHVWGQYRLARHPTALVPGVTLRLVQPNIAQDDKWRAENTRVIFDTLKELSFRPAQGAPVTHIIWPESAVSFFIDESAEARKELAEGLKGETVLLTGALRRDVRPDGSESIFTSLIVFDGAARPLAHYDKWRLVPGGEFLPFESILKPLGFRRVVTVPESFEAGPGPVSLTIPGAGKTAPLICYEVIFPNRLVDPKNRPQWLLNITNDGWFGRSTGPWQHFAQARLRAVEQGLPLARAANTGISGVIDPLGRVLARSELEDRTTLDVPLPLPLPATVYARYGDGLLAGLIAGVVLIGWRWRKSL